MMMRAKRKDDDIGPSKGAMKWINRFFRFILYPLIHPWWFVGGVIVVIVVLVAIPFYYGVGLTDIPAWYVGQFDKYYTKAETAITTKIIVPLKNGVEEQIKKATGMPSQNKIIMKTPKKEVLVDYENPQALNRKAFVKAQEIPVDVKKTLELGRAEQARVSFKRNDNLGLIYLESPRKIQGTAEVLNANEIKIGNEMFFLYGIYASMMSEKGPKAEKYLRDNIEGRNIECYIGAYTQAKIGTVICIYQGKNINQQLVDLGYSDDVSLN